MGAKRQSSTQCEYSPEAWEERCFANASHFRLHRFPDRASFETSDFAAALRAAHGEPRALLYAISRDGHAALLPRESWPRLAEVWLARQQ